MDEDDHTWKLSEFDAQGPLFSLFLFRCSMNLTNLNDFLSSILNLLIQNISLTVFILGSDF